MPQQFRYGVRSHHMSVLDRVFDKLIRVRVLMVLAFALCVLFFARKSFWLSDPPGIIYVSTNGLQGIIAFGFLALQRLSVFQAKRGNVKGAKWTLVPAFERLLWVLFVLTLADLYIITSDSPKVPHFVRAVDYDNSPLHVGDFFLFFFHAFIIVFNVCWSPFFLFNEHTLSQAAITRAIVRAFVASLWFALLALASYLQLQHQGIYWLWVIAPIVACGVVSLIAYVNLLLRGLKSSRRSVIPYAVMGCILGFFGTIFGCAVLAGIHNQNINSATPALSCLLGLLLALGHNTSLYISMYLDTNYWRGVSRIPIWCESHSPYEGIRDSLIQNELPALIESHLQFIDFAYIKYGPVIGRGATARVFRGHVCVGSLKGKQVAIKVFTPADMTSESLSAIAKEVARYANLQHPRVMRVFGVCVCPPDVCLVCELCEQGSLYDYIHSKTLSTREKLRLCLETAEAVAYIHGLQPPLLHRDLKSLNFLVSSDGGVKLSDFGTSTQLEPTRQRALSEMIGSVAWMCPEVLSRQNMYGLESDIYSLGVVLWEIWTQKEPYHDNNATLTRLKAQVLAGMRPTLPADIPQELSQLLQEMWSENPDKRPAASYVVLVLQELHSNPRPIAV